MLEGIPQEKRSPKWALTGGSLLPALFGDLLQFLNLLAAIGLMDVGCLLIVRTDLPPGEKLQNPPLMHWQYADGRPVLQKPTYAFVTL
jgi:hypothetical protein